ncbi:protein Skeletor, isoforms B/C isoform X1 [Procambarus clarkii]|uniref:protein Skeletor, isoforms B/C isoform X1 n=1 Tax=Procambarus clarkii TaxID=6728 RepID=UPI003743B44C
MVSWPIFFLLGVAAGVARAAGTPYKGAYIGELSTLEHGVTGKVYAVDNVTVYIENFSYDGEAPDAYFFAGNKSPQPSSRGFIIPDERGRNDVLGPYRNKNIVLRFPVTKKGQRSLNDVKWISVWCRQFAIDFGHVTVPPGLVKPAPQVATGLHSDKPALAASSVTVVDTDTIKVNDFTFDATVPDAIFVLGSGDAQSSGSQVLDEKGSLEPLKKYTQRSLVLSVPREVRGQPIQYFGVWSPTKGMISSVTFDTKGLLPPSLRSLRK